MREILSAADITPEIVGIARSCDPSDDTDWFPVFVARLRATGRTMRPEWTVARDRLYGQLGLTTHVPGVHH